MTDRDFLDRYGGAIEKIRGATDVTNSDRDRIAVLATLAEESRRWCEPSLSPNPTTTTNVVKADLRVLAVAAAQLVILLPALDAWSERAASKGHSDHALDVARRNAHAALAKVLP